MALAELNNLEWLDPWYQDLSGLESELQREVSGKHPLFGVEAIAVARGDGDDVLFYLPGHTRLLAVVHLTWHRESRPDFPFTVFYSSIDDFVETRMKPDHQEYLEVVNSPDIQSET